MYKTPVDGSIKYSDHFRQPETRNYKQNGMRFIINSFDVIIKSSNPSQND